MSARDDYPTGYGGTITWKQYETICDEIDRLRAQLRTEWTVQEGEHAAVCVPIERAKDDLIRELTKHADALREALAHCPQTLATPEREKLIAAYDEFIREA